MIMMKKWKIGAVFNLCVGIVSLGSLIGTIITSVLWRFGFYEVGRFGETLIRLPMTNILLEYDHIMENLALLWFISLAILTIIVIRDSVKTRKMFNMYVGIGGLVSAAMIVFMLIFAPAIRAFQDYIGYYLGNVLILFGLCSAIAMSVIVIRDSVSVNKWEITVGITLAISAFVIGILICNYLMRWI
jgi:hypothetical protein